MSRFIFLKINHHLTITYAPILTLWVSFMLQHSALDVISWFGLTTNVRLGDGIANDSQYPRQAFNVTLKTTHPGI